MNRKGDERLFFFVFILVVLVMIGGIVGGMSYFFNRGVELRNIHIIIIADKIENCFYNQGDNLFAEDFNLSSCGFNQDFLDKGYAIVINDSSNEKIFGLGDLRNRCGLKLVNEKSPFCFEETISYNRKDYSLFVGSIALPERVLNA